MVWKLEAGVSQEGGSIELRGWDWLCLVRANIPVLWYLRSRPIPCHGWRTFQGSYFLVFFAYLPMVSPSSHLATCPGLPCLAGDGWLSIARLRHIDDDYRPDAAMTSDAGGRMGARPWVARADSPDVSTAVDLFPHSLGVLPPSLPPPPTT